MVDSLLYQNSTFLQQRDVSVELNRTKFSLTTTEHSPRDRLADLEWDVLWVLSFVLMLFSLLCYLCQVSQDLQLETFLNQKQTSGGSRGQLAVLRSVSTLRPAGQSI